VIEQTGSTYGSVYLVRTDHIGRPVFSTGLSGAVVWRSEYLPFGGITFVSGTAEPKQVFPGQWFQGESGLHQNWMRDYDPVTGSYLQPDPLGLVDGPAVYAYAKGAPGVYTDPTGEFVPVAIAGIRIAVASYQAYRAVTAARTATQLATAAIALSTLGSDTPQDQDCPPEEIEYSVRVQIQGGLVSLPVSHQGIAITQDSPVKLRQVHLALTQLAMSLSPREQRLAKTAFIQASIWATRVASQGGIGPTSRSFRSGNISGSRLRVDIEVQRGYPNIVH